MVSRMNNEQTGTLTQKWSNLRDAAFRLKQRTIDVIDRQQGGVPKFYDNYILNSINFLEKRLSIISTGLDARPAWEQGQIQKVLCRLEGVISKNIQGRYLTSEQRNAQANTPDGRKIYQHPHGDEVDNYTINMSQGVDSCMHWKGQPIFKTVFDFSLHSMLLWDVKPKTIIEIGSGTGASAIWMADLMTVFELETKIFSLDIKKVTAIPHKNIRFIQGDCNAIDHVFPIKMLAELPHPWVVIEDAHVDVLNVLRHLSVNMLVGDYMIVEDSRGKKAPDVLTWSNLNKNKFKIDTKYTDYFGRNATCSPDTIFVRL